MTAVIPLDHADMTADVARQTCMRDRVDILRADAIARLKSGRRGRGAAELATNHDPLNIGNFELAMLERLGRRHGMAGFDLVSRDIAFVDQKVLMAKQPFPIV
jgi:hypothetical protein